MEWFMGSKSILDLLVYPTKQTIKLFSYLTPQKSIIIESISTTKPFLKFTLQILTFFEGEFWKKKWHWWIIDCSNWNAHATEKNPLLSAFTHCINRQLPEKSTLWTTTCCIDQLSRESANGFLGFYHIFCQILAECLTTTASVTLFLLSYRKWALKRGFPNYHTDYFSSFNGRFPLINCHNR